MLRRIAMIAIAIIIAACGDGNDDQALDISEARIVKISGDQSAQVPPPGTQSAFVLAAVVGTDGYTDEPLVARVEDPEPSSSITGPSLAVVPAGTLVHWQLEHGCGELFGTTTATDDSSYVVNRWAPGTVARTCEAAAGRLVGDSIVIDETWELVVLPGEAVGFSLDHGVRYDPLVVAEGDSIDLVALLNVGRDAYGNETDRDAFIVAHEPTWQWVIPEHTYQGEKVDGCYREADEPVPGGSGTGWVVTGAPAPRELQCPEEWSFMDDPQYAIVVTIAELGISRRAYVDIEE